MVGRPAESPRRHLRCLSLMHKPNLLPLEASPPSSYLVFLVFLKAPTVPSSGCTETDAVLAQRGHSLGRKTRTQERTEESTQSGALGAGSREGGEGLGLLKREQESTGQSRDVVSDLLPAKAGPTAQPLGHGPPSWGPGLQQGEVRGKLAGLGDAVGGAAGLLPRGAAPAVKPAAHPGPPGWPPS